MAAEENSLEGHKVIAFAKNVDLIAQQTQSALTPHVMADLAYAGKGTEFTDELMGTSDPEAILDDTGDTPIGNVDKFRRRAFFMSFGDGQLIGDREKAEQLVDPTNAVVRAVAAGLQRFRDKSIVDMCFFNPAYQNNKKGEPVSTSFPAANIVAVNEWGSFKGKADGGGTAPTTQSGLTPPKIRKMLEIIDKSNIKGQVNIGVERADLNNLLTSTETTSSDYSAVKALVHGEINTFMDVNFVRMNYGLAPAVSGQAGQFKLPCWIKDNCVYKERILVATKIWEDASKQFVWRLFYKKMNAGLRRQDAGVVHIIVKR
ncbi:MAG: hypothetical protein COA84_07575 [Robiginitomaculum sp.]|nr:MAG: hypothetical protein COA84_07575 [Robiginitomaculum sp.]